MAVICFLSPSLIYYFHRKNESERGTAYRQGPDIFEAVTVMLQCVNKIRIKHLTD